MTTIFSRYDKHRRLLLDDILASIARLPSSKRGLRTFRLSADQHIQMLTALVLQLIQCVLSLPEKLGAPPGTTVQGEDTDSSVLVRQNFFLKLWSLHTKRIFINFNVLVNLGHGSGGSGSHAVRYCSPDSCQFSVGFSREVRS